MLKYVLLIVGSLLYILISTAIFHYEYLRRAKKFSYVTYKPNQWKLILFGQCIITVVFDIWYVFSK